MLLAFVVALLLAIFQMVAKVVLVRPLFLYNSGFMASIRVAAAHRMPWGLISRLCVTLGMPHLSYACPSHLRHVGRRCHACKFASLYLTG